MFDEKKYFPPMGCPETDGCFPPEKPFADKPNFTGIENLEHTKRELHEMMNRLLRFEKMIQEKFDDTIKHLTTDNVTFKSTFAESHRLFIEEVKNEINRFESNVDNSITLFTTTLGDKYDKYTEQVTTHFNESVAELKTRIDTYVENYNEDFENFRTSILEAHESFKEEVNARCDEIDESTTADIKGFKTSMTNEMSTFKANVSTELSNFKSAISSELSSHKTAVSGELTKHKTDTADLYNSHVQEVNTRIDENNQAMSQAMTDYQQKLTTDINSFQATVNTRHTTFTESITESFNIFRETLETVVNERLNTQDGKISDAELYMKTNLVGTVAQHIGDMRDTGELAEIIEEEVFPDIANYYVTPEMFGAVGDGETDDTEAVQEALQRGLVVRFEGVYKITHKIDNDNGGVSTAKAIYGYGTIKADFGQGISINCGNVLQHVKNITLESVNLYNVKTRCYFENVTVKNRAYFSAYNSVVNNCYFDNSDVYLNGDNIINNCTFNNSGVADTNSHNTIFNYCKFISTVERYYFITTDSATQIVSFNNCTFNEFQAERFEYNETHFNNCSFTTNRVDDETEDYLFYECAGKIYMNNVKITIPDTLTFAYSGTFELIDVDMGNTSTGPASFSLYNVKAFVTMDSGVSIIRPYWVDEFPPVTLSLDGLILLNSKDGKAYKCDGATYSWKPVE